MSNQLILVTMEGCNPCKMAKEKFKALTEEGKIKVVTLEEAIKLDPAGVAKCFGVDGSDDLFMVPGLMLLGADNKTLDCLEVEDDDRIRGILKDTG